MKGSPIEAGHKVRSFASGPYKVKVGGFLWTCVLHLRFGM